MSKLHLCTNTPCRSPAVAERIVEGVVITLCRRCAAKIAMFVVLDDGLLVPVGTFAEAARLVRRVIEEECLGASDLPATFGQIRQEREIVARVSFNGQVRSGARGDGLRIDSPLADTP